MLIAVRCAPGQSYVNPAERVMSVLNYALRNIATERQKMDKESEKVFQRCSGDVFKETRLEKSLGRVC